MRGVVTICDKNYADLLPLWRDALRMVTNLPLFVLCLNGFVPEDQLGLVVIPVNPEGNPFPVGTPDHACAEKLRVFHHLPMQITKALFIDVDVLVLRNFWTEPGYFEASSQSLVIAQDVSLGYREKLEEVFRAYDDTFRAKYNVDGSQFYFNTGVWFADRNTHALWFAHVLDTWVDYVAKTGQSLGIWDQDVTNFCIIQDSLSVIQMSVHNNCLRQYNPTVVNGMLMLNESRVNAYHFNGGGHIPGLKAQRWREMLAKLEVNP